MRHAFMAAAMLGLAACGGGGDAADGERADGTSGAAPGATAQVALQPGQWEVTTEVIGADLSSLPPELRGMRPSHTFRHCLTPEEARQNETSLLAGTSGDDECRYEEFSFSNGRLQARLRCEHDGEMDLGRLDGRVTPTSYEINMAAEEGDTAGLQTRISSRRIGECTAEQLANP